MTRFIYKTADDLWIDLCRRFEKPGVIHGYFSMLSQVQYAWTWNGELRSGFGERAAELLTYLKIVQADKNQKQFPGDVRDCYEDIQANADSAVLCNALQFLPNHDVGNLGALIQMPAMGLWELPSTIWTASQMLRIMSYMTDLEPGELALQVGIVRGDEISRIKDAIVLHQTQFEPRVYEGRVNYDCPDMLAKFASRAFSLSLKVVHEDFNEKAIDQLLGSGTLFSECVHALHDKFKGDKS